MRRFAYDSLVVQGVLFCHLAEGSWYSHALIYLCRSFKEKTVKQVTVLALAAAFVASVSFVNADDAKITSGLKVGDGIGPFNVTKCAGASEDGVSVGDNLCYRCKNGPRPQVMVFTRSSDAKVIELVSKLDKAISKNSDKQLRAFVNYMADSKDAASESVKKLAKETSAKNVPFVVPNEFENGPEDYGINAKAEVTIILAESSKVKANHAVAKAKDLDVASVVADLEKILN